MSTREDLIYAKIVAADKKAAVPVTTQDAAFFFPTQADVKIAKKWLDRDITTPADTGPLATALRLVAGRNAVPLVFLRIVRRLEEDK
jgi:hypothetical protein